jgi:Ran GTPase-activating protein (RanGAP) involved in mRNA processing and transport
MVRLIQPKRPTAISLNLRNSTFTPNAVYYISTTLSSPNYYITALSFKFCFLSFDDLLMLSDGIKFNKTLVKLDLSNNCFKPCMTKFLFEALLDNCSIADLNLSTNFLNDEFAVDLAHLLESNQQLHKVDISNNPIGPEGAKYLLESILAHNDSLESLGNIKNNVYMGVRLCEEIT